MNGDGSGNGHLAPGAVGGGTEDGVVQLGVVPRSGIGAADAVAAGAPVEAAKVPCAGAAGPDRRAVRVPIAVGILRPRERGVQQRQRQRHESRTGEQPGPIARTSDHL